jgi:hypothetical protein
MTKSRLQLVAMLGRLLSIACLVGFFSVFSLAQGTKPLPPPTGFGDKDEPPIPIASIEAEMLAKREIQIADKAQRENLARARDLSFLSSSIVSSFKKKDQLDREDLKKLDKVEKLAKGIRHAAGGSDDRVELDKQPTDIGATLTMFAEISESLKCRVEKTPKHVISAAVIDEANVILELIRILRTLPATPNP